MTLTIAHMGDQDTDGDVLIAKAAGVRALWPLPVVATPE